VTTPARDPRVLAAVVNYKRADLTMATVESLLALGTDVPVRIMVIDSASGASDLGALRAGLSPTVELVALDVNRGYGAACNAAIRLAYRDGIPYIWLLNNDITLESGCLTELVAALDDNAHLAAVAPTVVEFDHPDLILSCGVDVSMWRGTTRHRRWGRSTAELPAGVEFVDALEASALLVRTAATEAFGGFDESFFMYWEDVEWSMRASPHGWQLASVAQARILHRLSQSSSPIDRLEYMIRNRIRVVRLCGSGMDQVTFMAYMTLGWLPAYALTRMLFHYGPTATARTILRPLLWNVRDSIRRRHWRLTRADQEIGTCEGPPPNE